MFKAVLNIFLVVTLVLIAPMARAESVLQDPTKPLGYTSAKGGALASLKLHSVLISDQRKVAVINGQRLVENDVIEGSGGTVLERIKPHSVLVNKAGKRWQLKLQNTLVLQKTQVNQ